MHAEDGVFDRGDPLLTAWILAWDHHQLSDNPLRFFQANIFYPFPDVLAYSEHILGPALLASPVRLVTSNPIAIQNVSIVTAFVLLGVAAFLFFRWVSGNSIAAMCGALLVTIAPVRMPQLGHLQILHTAGIPVLIYGLWSYLERPRVGAALIFFGGFLFEALTSFYLGFMALLCCVVLLAVAALSLGIRRVWSSTVRLLPGAAVTALILLPFLAPYWRLRRELGFVRSLEQQWASWASHKAYFRPFPGSVAAWIFPTFAGTFGSSLYIGLVTIALAVAGTFWSSKVRGSPDSRRRIGVLFFTMLGLVAFVLSLGGWRDLGGGRRLLLPFYYLHQLPGIDGLRATMRFSILVDFAVVGLAVLGLARIGQRRERTRPAVAAGLVAGLGLLAFVERSPRLPIAPEERVLAGDEISHVYRRLARDPEAKVLELPMSVGRGLREGWDVVPYEQVYFSTVHWRPIVNGVSGYLPPGYGSLVTAMGAFPSRQTLATIRDLPVNRLLVRRRRYRPPVPSSLFREEDGFRILHECPDDLLVSVLPDSTPRRLLPAVQVIEAPRKNRSGRVRMNWAADLPPLIYPPVRIRIAARSRAATGEERESASDFWLSDPRSSRDFRVWPGASAASLTVEVRLPDGQTAARTWDLVGQAGVLRPGDGKEIQ